MRGTRSLVAAAVLLLAGAAGARADVVSIGTLTAKVLNDSSSMRTVSFAYDGVSGSGLGGLIKWDRADAGVAGRVPEDLIPDRFSTYCIELYQDVYLGRTYTYDVYDALVGTAPSPGGGPSGHAGPGPLTADKLGALNDLWDAFYTDSLVSADKSSAFQVAVWEIVFEKYPAYGFDLSGGRFKATSPSAVVSQAQYFLDNRAIAPHEEHFSLYAMVNRDSQDQALGVGFAKAAPLPSAAWAGLGLISLIIGSRLRRRA